MAETAEEKAARKQDLAEAFKEGLKLFNAEQEEERAKAAAANGGNKDKDKDDDSSGGKSFAERLLGF